MGDMGDHSGHSGAGDPLRRARRWAWLVFWVTAGSSVLYNCYHALVGESMPWYTGCPEGFVPLLVAIGVLEFAGAWRKNVGLQAAAWLVTCGAMAWSAFATNSVVHQGWAFGLIADTAALSAMYFLLNGPTAQQAVAAVDRKVAELTAAADAERAAREQDARAHQRATAELRAAQETALARAQDAHAASLRTVREELETERLARREAQAEAALHASAEAERDIARAELDGARSGLQAAQDARADAEARAQRAEAESARLARKAGAQNRPRRARKDSAGQASGSVPKDVDARAEALARYLENPGISGAELGTSVGMSKRWGQDRMKEFKTSVTESGSRSEGADS